MHDEVGGWFNWIGSQWHSVSNKGPDKHDADIKAFVTWLSKECRHTPGMTLVSISSSFENFPHLVFSHQSCPLCMTCCSWSQKPWCLQLHPCCFPASTVFTTLTGSEKQQLLLCGALILHLNNIVFINNSNIWSSLCMWFLLVWSDC